MRTKVTPRGTGIHGTLDRTSSWRCVGDMFPALQMDVTERLLGDHMKQQNLDRPRRHRLGSFEEFFAGNYEQLVRALYLVTGDAHEAEELAQEACVRVLQRWDRLGGTDNPVGYAYRTALNLHRSHLRRLASAGRRPLRREEPDALRSVDERDALR